MDRVRELSDALELLVGADHVLAGDAIPADYRHDETLSGPVCRPLVAVRPESAAQVADILRHATAEGIPVTARGAGSGLCGGAVPRGDGIVVSFERMNAIREIDVENQVAVVQPGVSLAELAEKAGEVGLDYPVSPGELSASIGGTVATNAGGMRAVKYGVTRHHVLGLEAVLPTGEVIRTGGKIVKVSSGYDLTQLIVGSEGTLALVTEATVKLSPKLTENATVLAPFDQLSSVTAAVSRIVASGMEPSILEYIDGLTMAAITHTAQLSLGIPDDVRERSQAYLVVSLENRDAGRLDEDVQALGERLVEWGAADVYVLPGGAARKLIEAREHAFWTAKAAGANDIIDTVVPRAALPEFFAKVGEIMAADEGSYVFGCGHAGDGNVHLAVFQSDDERRARVVRALFEAGLELGGAISGEHGIGREKKPYFLELTDPAKVALMVRIKAAFDPAGILNPDVMLPSPGPAGG